jgi:RHS repeat-associated protein
MGFTTTFLHDPGNRLLTIDYPDPDADVTFDYDPAGNRTSMVDGVGSTTWVYDSLHRATAITDPFDGTVGYDYDSLGNRTQLTYPDGKIVSYEYDPGNRMTQVNDWDGNITSYQYNAADQLLTTLLPNGVTSSYSYDEAGQLLLLKHESETELLSSFQYTYDAVGNRTQVIETMLWPWQPAPNVPASSGASLPEPNLTGQMAADPLMVMMAPLVLLVALSSRLRRRGGELPKGILVLVIIAGLGLGISACIPIPTLPPFPTRTPRVTSTPTTTPTFTPSPVPSDTPTPSPTPEPIPVVITTIINYAYDPLNRLTAADYDSGEFFHYNYDPVGNRLRQETHNNTNIFTYDAANRLIEVDGVAYTWDANGNLLNDGKRTFIYDHANRLTGLSGQANDYGYAYNGLGDRLKQTVDGITTNYSLDLNSGLTQVFSDESNTYLYGLGRIGELQAGGWQFHLADALGSVRQIPNPGAVVDLSQSYEPFGTILYDAGKSTSSYGYIGEWMDMSDLVHLRARYLDPISGRFISKDPRSGYSFAPMSQNKYIYGYSNPMMYSDPTGEDPLSTCGTIFVVLALADGPLPIGETAGGLTCVAIFGVALISSILAAQHADDVADAIEDMLNDCNRIGDIFSDSVTRTRPRIRTYPGERLYQDPLAGPVIWERGRTELELKPEPKPRPEPREVGPDIIPWDIDRLRPKWILYHYSNATGVTGIVASQMILPSLGDGNLAAYGYGQYFTDISTVDAAKGSPYQLSRAIFNIPYNFRKVTHFVAINVAGLPIENVGPVYTRTYGERSIYLHRSVAPLNVSNRIEASGPVLFSD